MSVYCIIYTYFNSYAMNREEPLVIFPSVCEIK